MSFSSARAEKEQTRPTATTKNATGLIRTDAPRRCLFVIEVQVMQERVLAVSRVISCRRNCLEGALELYAVREWPLS